MTKQYFHGDRETYEDKLTLRTVARVWFQPDGQMIGRWVTPRQWDEIHGDKPAQGDTPTPAPAAKILPDHVTRMQQERRELEIKIAALSNFLKGPRTATLSRLKLNLLGAQLGAMNAYSDILAIRLEIELSGD